MKIKETNTICKPQQFTLSGTQNIFTDCFYTNLMGNAYFGVDCVGLAHSWNNETLLRSIVRQVANFDSKDCTNTYHKCKQIMYTCTSCLKKTFHLWLAILKSEWILIFFGRNVTDKVSYQKTLYYATSNNFCFCTTWQNGETRKLHISP